MVLNARFVGIYQLYCIYRRRYKQSKIYAVIDKTQVTIEKGDESDSFFVGRGTSSTELY